MAGTSPAMTRDGFRIPCGGAGASVLEISAQDNRGCGEYRFLGSRHHLLHPLRRLHCKALIPLAGDVVADSTVSADAADIGHDDQRLAGDVGADAPAGV